MMRALLLAAACASLASPAFARAPCQDAQVEEFAALFRDAGGNVSLLIARVRHRLETEDVECWAKRGSKPMILELGKRFEEGDGVSRDVRRAESLYTIAAASSGGPLWIYSPGIMGSPGRVMQVDGGPLSPGLAEGAYRRALMHVEGRAHRASIRKGFKMLETLAKAGHEGAKARLAALPRT